MTDTSPSSRSSLADCPVGVVPIVWNNIDVPDVRDGLDAATVLDEVARLGFAGCQFGEGFPTDGSLSDELARRNLRLAEIYASIACTPDGPVDGGLDAVLARLDVLDRGDGDVLVVAIDVDPQRGAFAARTTAPECPQLSDAGWDELASLLRAVAEAVEQRGRRGAFHPHAGTYVENPAETARLVGLLREVGLGLCLDVAHYTVGGGDPVTAIAEYADIVSHVHVKDVDPAMLAELRAGTVATLHDALRRRVFTELGQGCVDVAGVLRALDAAGYAGWLMIEQDTSWLAPAEATAADKAVLEFARREVAVAG